MIPVGTERLTLFVLSDNIKGCGNKLTKIITSAKRNKGKKTKKLSLLLIKILHLDLKTPTVAKVSNRL